MTYIVFDAFGNVTDRMDDPLLALERRRERCVESKLYHLSRGSDRVRLDDDGKVIGIDD